MKPIIKELSGNLNTGHFYVKTQDDNIKRCLRYSKRFGYYVEGKKYFKKFENKEDIKRINDFIND